MDSKSLVRYYYMVLFIRFYAHGPNYFFCVEKYNKLDYS